MAAGKTLRARQWLGKYRIERRLANGPRAAVYQAYDTVHGIKVALKVPHVHLLDEVALDEFRREARLSAQMEHPNVLPIQNACYFDDLFVIAMPLGVETLFDRMSRRMSAGTALNFAEQAMAAVAHAHSRKIIHCDVKPDNFIVFDDDRLRLADFGFSKVAVSTVKASGSGTVGYVAPEQALGRPMFQSDVFSLGLVIWQLFAGQLFEWPFKWPPPGNKRARERLRPATIAWLRKSMETRHQDRYANAVVMEKEFNKLKPKVLRPGH